MTHERTIRFFGDIVPEARIISPAPRRIPAEVETDEELMAIMWEAMNGRGKRAAAPVAEDRTAMIYYAPVEDEYTDWDKEIEEALKEARA